MKARSLPGAGRNRHAGAGARRERSGGAAPASVSTGAEDAREGLLLKDPARRPSPRRASRASMRTRTTARPSPSAPSTLTRVTTPVTARLRRRGGHAQDAGRSISVAARVASSIAPASSRAVTSKEKQRESLSILESARPPDRCPGRVDAELEEGRERGRLHGGGCSAAGRAASTPVERQRAPSIAAACVIWAAGCRTRDDCKTLFSTVILFITVQRDDLGEPRRRADIHRAFRLLAVCLICLHHIPTGFVRRSEITCPLVEPAHAAPGVRLRAPPVS